MSAVLEHAAGLLFIERDVLLALVELSVLVIAQTLNELSADQGRLDDFLHVVGADFGIKPAFRLDADQRSHLAEAVAAGLLDSGRLRGAVGEVQRDFKSRVVQGHLVFQFLVDLQVSAGRAAGAAADQDLALLVLPRFDAFFLQSLEGFQAVQFLTHLLRPPLSVD